MANRHLARSTVLQSLYEWDFGGKDESKVPDIVTRNTAEFAPGATDGPFIQSLINGVIKKRVDLDKIIEKAAPDWPIDKISIMDRNILRIGLYELLFAARTEVPAKVAINEAIELAKSYGSDTSSKFVNGVLGAVYKEMGEPGKEETSKKKKIPDKITYENLGGAVVYAHHDGDVYLALVHDIFGHWTLTKGRIEAGEELEKGTLREISEELGLTDVSIKQKLDENEYTAFNPEKGKMRKHVHYFLVESSFKELKLEEEKGGLDAAQWFKMKDILDLNFYNDILPIITKAINLIMTTYTAKK